MNIKVLLIFNIIFLINRYNTTSFTMGYLVQIPEVFDTQEMYDEVRDFVKHFNALFELLISHHQRYYMENLMVTINQFCRIII